MPSISLPTAILGASVIAGGSSLLAGSQQADAANNANALQAKIYDQNRADLTPWREAGTNALAQLQYSLGIGPAPTTTGSASNPLATMGGKYGAFQQSPGYQFAFDQGQKATAQGYAARGLGQSGAAMKALTRYGQGTADQEYGNWLARLQSVAGLGQTATGQGVVAGQNYANASGNLVQDAAASRASGYVGAGNAFGGGVNQLAQLGYFGQPGGSASYANGTWTPGPQGFPG